ncbi:hypothetical protein [Bacillus sp. FJAT-29937]|uniref:hypothetical protein n=1 Tax=Bacillus sp. FJAT-29937 TaxID=1720553 RepID=UPI0009E6C859|nr:hypothetical protein [Bacillus sp. FJAT-29937]
MKNSRAQRGLNGPDLWCTFFYATITYYTIFFGAWQAVLCLKNGEAGMMDTREFTRANGVERLVSLMKVNCLTFIDHQCIIILHKEKHLLSI